MSTYYILWSVNIIQSLYRDNLLRDNHMISQKLSALLYIAEIKSVANKQTRLLLLLPMPFNFYMFIKLLILILLNDINPIKITIVRSIKESKGMTPSRRILKICNRFPKKFPIYSFDKSLEKLIGFRGIHIYVNIRAIAG